MNLSYPCISFITYRSGTLVSSKAKIPMWIVDCVRAFVWDHCVFCCAKRVSFSLGYMYSVSVVSENVLVTLKVIEMGIIFIGCV